MREQDFEKLKIILMKRVGGLTLRGKFPSLKFSPEFEEMVLRGEEGAVVGVKYFSQIDVFEDRKKDVLTLVCHTKPINSLPDERKAFAFKINLSNGMVEFLGAVVESLKYDSNREHLVGAEPTFINDTLLVIRDTLKNLN